MLFALHFDDFRRCVVDKLLVAEFLHYACEEAFVVLEVCLDFLDFFFNVDVVGQWNGKFGGSDEERRCSTVFFGNVVDA